MSCDSHDQHRMDDDGGCVQPIPVKIGIAPATVSPNSHYNQTRFGVGSVTASEPSRLVFANGSSVNAGPVATDLVGVTGETLTSLTWDKYLAWRRTKCRPFDQSCTGLATKPKSAVTEGQTSLAVRAIEEIDQAVLEVIGEVAELGELFLAHGPIAPFFEGEIRTKLIDECGDIFFCACWSMDAWGDNPLAGIDDLEILRVEEGSELEGIANAFLAHTPEEIMGNKRFRAVMSNMIQGSLVGMQTAAGLLANSFKKLKFQRREQDVEVQIGRIASVLTIANQILIIANSSVEEALKSNMRKLDARYPNGYQPGQGGGIREGAGK